MNCDRIWLLGLSTWECAYARIGRVTPYLMNHVWNLWYGDFFAPKSTPDLINEGQRE